MGELGLGQGQVVDGVSWGLRGGEEGGGAD